MELASCSPKETDEKSMCLVLLQINHEFSSYFVFPCLGVGVGQKHKEVIQTWTMLKWILDARGCIQWGVPEPSLNTF